MARPLHEQVVVITGASSGIGRAAALKFGQVGASVVLAARNEAALQAVANQIREAGGRVHVVVTDVAEWTQVSNLAHEAVRMFGRIDTWVNNAAVAVYATVDDTTVEEIDRVIRVNLLGQMYGVKAAVPIMKREHSGTIINIASVEGERALPYHAVYAASKHAVKGFTEALRLEMEHDKTGIDVVLILPSSINTPFFNHARSRLGVLPRPIPPVYSPELAADAIVAAAQHPRRAIYVGGAGFMLRTLEAISPRLADRLMLTGGSAFKAQHSDRADDDRDNLFEPSWEGRTEGDFGHLTKPSLYTRLMMRTPIWARVVVPALAAAALIWRRL